MPVRADPASIRVLGRPYGPTMSTAETAQLWGCSCELLQRRAKSGELPVRPLVLGNRLRWPTVLVAEALGLPVEMRPVPP